MGFRNVVNDGSADQPRLRLQPGMEEICGLGGGDLGQFLDRMAGAGFSGLEANCSGEHEANELGTMVRDRRLAIGYAAVAGDVDDLLNPLELAHRMRADYLSVRVMGSLKGSPDIAEVLEGMYELVNDAGLPLFVETRSGSVTQDLRRTVKVINRFKKVRFTGDFGHYIASCELAADWSEDVEDHFSQIARRCGNWHGRLSPGEMTQQIKRLWSLGMGAWLNRARPGDVLPFSCEPGPGGWEHCLAIKRLAEETWTEAKAMQGPAENPVTVELAAPAEIAANQGMH
jgi:hypothetical protein